MTLQNRTELTETGYRLYDSKALEKLQEILFFRELEIPLMDIKNIMDTPNYDTDFKNAEAFAGTEAKSIKRDYYKKIYVANGIKRYYGA